MRRANQGYRAFRRCAPLPRHSNPHLRYVGMTRRPERSAIVIGAGPAGLAAADALVRGGTTCTVIESQDAVGGLSGSFRADNFAWDYGGHRLVSSHPSVMRLARELVGADMRLQERRSRILFEGRFWPHPLETAHVLRSLDISLAIRAIAGSVAARAARHDDTTDFESWVVSHFGRPLYEAFFGPYTRKVWGVDPSMIASAWAPRRIMVGSLLRLLAQIFHAAGPLATLKHYHYPRLGIGQLYEALAARIVSDGGSILLGHTAQSVQVDAAGVTVTVRSASEVRDFHADAIVNTAPLPFLLAHLAPRPPEAVVSAAKRLRFRGIVFVFVGLARSRGLGWDALYVPQPEYVFFRVDEPTRWSKDLAPAGMTSLCFEIAADPGDEVWEADPAKLIARCVSDLARIGVHITRREVVAAHVQRRPHVYPMELNDSRRDLQLCRDFVDTLGPQIQSVGRLGAFRYIDMDQAILMGLRAAGMIDGNGSKIERAAEGRGYLWSAERQLA